MRQILMVVCSVALFSCTKTRDKNCTTPPQPILIRLVDSNGGDLLNPSNLHAYNIADMDITYLDNNSVKSSPVSLHSFANADAYFLTTDLGWHANNGRVFFLKLSDNDVDTIYLRNDQVSNNGCNYFDFKEFKYNNVSYLPVQIVTDQPSVFEIKK